MKKTAVVAGLLVIFGLACLWVSPYATVLNIASAIFDGDSQALNEHVDFPILKRNLKDQIHAFLAEGAASESKGGSSSALGKMIGPKMMDGVIDSIVTPTSVILLAKKAGDLSARNEQMGSSWRRAVAIFHQGRYGYDSFSTFSYWLPTQRGDVRFELERSGIRWKLTNAVIPPEYLTYLQESIPHKR